MPEIAALQEQLAFLEHDVEQLDQVVRKMNDTLDAVRGDVARLRDETGDRFARLAEEDEDDG